MFYIIAMSGITKAEERFIKEQLGLYQCSDREVEIYLAALSSGPSSIQQLAVRLGQNRITVHSATAQLVKKGLLYESRKGKRRLLVAEEPHALDRLLKIKEADLDTAKANLGYVVKLLHRIQTPSGDRPDVQFYEGKDGFKRMLELTLSSKNDFLGLINVELFSKHLTPEYLENYFVRRAAHGIRSRLIWPKREGFAAKMAARSAELKLQVKFLAADSLWTSGVISWNDCVSLKSFSDGQITCTIIQNRDIADFYRNVIFEALWHLARP